MYSELREINLKLREMYYELREINFELREANLCAVNKFQLLSLQPSRTLDILVSVRKNKVLAFTCTGFNCNSIAMLAGWNSFCNE